MLTDATITLYTKYLSSVGKQLYKKTVITKDNAITGATWQGKKESSLQTGTLNVVDTVNIRIPILNNNFGGTTYIEPKAWLKLSDADRDKYFTFQQGDKIVKGDCSYEFDPATNPITNLDKFDNVVSIISIKINDFGSKRLNHYNIGGK